MEMREMLFTGEDVVNKPSRKRAVDARTPQKPPPPVDNASPTTMSPPRQFVSRTAVLLHGFGAAEATELGRMLTIMGATLCDDEAAVLRAAQATTDATTSSDIPRRGLVVACEAGADAGLLRLFADAPVSIVNAAWVHDTFRQATTAPAEVPEGRHQSLVRSLPGSCSLLYVQARAPTRGCDVSPSPTCVECPAFCPPPPHLVPPSLWCSIRARAIVSAQPR